MLQQRFLITLFFFRLRFSYKIFLFFVQFSVQFLFFTCFFLLQKNTASFPFFLLFLTLSHADFCFFFFVVSFLAEKIPTMAPCQWQGATSENVAAQADPRGDQNQDLSPETGRWGFVVCVCVSVLFVWVCDFFLFECMLFSLHLYTYVTFL